MNDLEKHLTTAGSKVILLDEDGSVSTAAGGNSENGSK